jgi:hypothetical protein
MKMVILKCFLFIFSQTLLSYKENKFLFINFNKFLGKFISTLIIDPYIRPGKIDNIWSYSGRGMFFYLNF